MCKFTSQKRTKGASRTPQMTPPNLLQPPKTPPWPPGTLQGPQGPPPPAPLGDLQDTSSIRPEPPRPCPEPTELAQNPETLPDASRGPPERFLDRDINPRPSTHGKNLVDKTLATQQLATQHPASSNQPLVYETLGTRNGPAECAKRLN